MTTMTRQEIAAMEERVNNMTYDTMLKRQKALSAECEAAYAKTDPLQALLDAANAEEQVARAKAQSLADQIDSLWGPEWISKKKELGMIANRLMMAKKLGLMP